MALETDVSRGVGDKLETVAELVLLRWIRRWKPSAGGPKPSRRWFVSGYSPHGFWQREIGYFTGGKRSVLYALESKGVVQLSQRECYRQVDAQPVLPASMPQLNEEQEHAFQGISAMLGQAGCALLYGVTGSGENTGLPPSDSTGAGAGAAGVGVGAGDRVDTPDASGFFRAQFGEQVAILHSSLSAGARYDEWKRARKGDARVVVGTRSAVFAPLSQLGMIIVDEEHEGSYKSESVPRYHAREIAKYRCSRHQAVLVLGSATPSVESMYCAKNGAYQLFSIDQTVQ